MNILQVYLTRKYGIKEVLLDLVEICLPSNWKLETHEPEPDMIIYSRVNLEDTLVLPYEIIPTDIEDYIEDYEDEEEDEEFVFN